MGIKEFMQKYAQDKEFAAKYQALPSLDAALEEAEKDGYSIAKDEALAALQNNNDGELTDEELAFVAGGKILIPTGPCLNCGSTELTHKNSRLRGGIGCLICAECGARRS